MMNNYEWHTGWIIMTTQHNDLWQMMNDTHFLRFLWGRPRHSQHSSFTHLEFVPLILQVASDEVYNLVFPRFGIGFPVIFYQPCLPQIWNRLSGNFWSTLLMCRDKSSLVEGTFRHHDEHTMKQASNWLHLTRKQTLDTKTPGVDNVSLSASMGRNLWLVQPCGQPGWITEMDWDVHTE